MNVMRELEEFLLLCSDALRESRDMNDELADRVMSELLAEADRIIAVTRLALSVQRSPETLVI